MSGLECDSNRMLPKRYNNRWIIHDRWETHKTCPVCFSIYGIFTLWTYACIKRGSTSLLNRVEIFISLYKKVLKKTVLLRESLVNYKVSTCPTSQIIDPLYTKEITYLAYMPINGHLLRYLFVDSRTVSESSIVSITECEQSTRGCYYSTVLKSTGHLQTRLSLRAARH